MRESDLHRNIFARSADLAAAFPGIIAGPGDDCAVVRSASGDTLLLKVDQVVAERHFTLDTPIDLIARKAIARTVSDIAAMGGSPRWGLASGVLPPHFPHADDLCARLAHWGRAFRLPLVGGDIATGPDHCPLSLSITAVGIPHPTRGPVLRTGALPGDELWVTGRIGASLSSNRHLTFAPRLAEAHALCDTLGDRLHAMLDISDGLGRDAARLAAASNVRIVIDADRIPLHPERTDPLLAAADGEDYELLFTTAPDSSVRPSLATRIGRVHPGTGCTMTLPGGREVEAGELGWDHGRE